MQVSDRQAIAAHDIPETQDQAELRRTAHKIAWTRMNGRNDAVNPFVEADSNGFAPGDGRREPAIAS